MILEKGDMWDVFGKTDLFLITTNPIERKDGGIVMGRGIAKQASIRFPSIPHDFSKALKDSGYSNVGYIGHYPKYEQVMGWFMVKDHWKEPAKCSIIRESVRQLNEWVQEESIVGRIDLNFPGIGNGKLSREEVLPLLQELTGDVHIWEQ